MLYDFDATSIRYGYGDVTIVPDLNRHTRLTELAFNYNRLHTVGLLPASLTHLDLSNNTHLQRFPLAICTLVHLKELHLTRISLRSVPDEIRNCALLEELRLDENLLTSLPAAIGLLGALRWLYLNNNQLSSLPGSIVNLHALESFEVHSNRGWLGRRLGKTPAEVMKRLREMDLLTGVEYLADLKAMINNTAFSDVQLVLQDGLTIDAHRFMLKRSPAFMLTRAPLAAPETPDGSMPSLPYTYTSPSSRLTIELNEDYDMVLMLVEYLYTHRLSHRVFASPETIKEFAALADRYSLGDVAAWLRAGEHVVGMHLLFALKLSPSPLSLTHISDESNPTFVSDLRYLLEPRDSDADVEIRLADGTAMYCHRALLAARSDYYLCLFQSGLAESRSSSIAAPVDTSPAVMRLVLAWIYSSDHKLLTGDNSVELLVASDRFRVETLRSAAQAFLLSGLELDNAPYLWALARTHRAKHLELSAVEVMRVAGWAQLQVCSTWNMLIPEELPLLREAMYSNVTTA